MTIKVRKGKGNTDADALSRLIKDPEDVPEAEDLDAFIEEETTFGHGNSDAIALVIGKKGQDFDEMDDIRKILQQKMKAGGEEPGIDQNIMDYMGRSYTEGHRNRCFHIQPR